MPDWTVREAKKEPQPGDWDWWSVEVLDENRSRRIITFPDWALERHAAEYDLDEDDPEALLDSYVHMILSPDPEKNATLDGAARAGLTRMGRPVTLYNADSRAQAREALKARVEETKRSRRIVDPDDHCRVIRDDYRAQFNPRRIAAFRADVDRARARVRAKELQAAGIADGTIKRREWWEPIEEVR